MRSAPSWAKRHGGRRGWCLERIGQGKDSVKEFLQNNPDIAEEVEAKVRGNLLNAAAREPAKPAQRAIAVSADDFNDED